MVQKGVSQMINGAVRIKWGKYRFVVLAVLVVNVVLINHFFFNSSFTTYINSPEGIEAVNEYASTLLPNGAIPADPSTLAAQAPAPELQPLQQIVALDKVPPTTPPMLHLDDYDFNGPYIGWPLARACNETKWQPGFVFVCDNNSGGIGNIRNFILTCIRYAIEAGASGIIMPRIQRRSEDNLANIFTTGFQPFTYFFDEKHFKDSMTEFCPQMTLYDNVDQIPNSKNKKEAKEFYPKELNKQPDGCDGRGVNRHLDHFRRKIDAWAVEFKNVPSVERPVTLRFKWATFFEWPIMRDGPEFAATFGDLLRINKDIQELATFTIREMAKFTGEDPDGKSPPKYLGVHLRTESDALGFWPNFEQQSTGYIKKAEEHKMKYAYLASGNITEGHRLGELAAEKIGLKTTTKMDLLTGDRLKQLTDLSWDQQALVDFLVLQKSTHFTGCSFSSFAMNIAIKRHLMTDGIFSRAWKSPGDQFSTLVGRFESWYGDWMFMYECMWP
ncbi:uncharacterized protein L3040_003776 [Drepanopeziza brunnea f. sp. 'multigermtubi']|uniref:uncharacterized protein n=1 Tax=Drepanopeziza brunnea f. sp. 'multigermtubi' TaxID=698441 RepID=UPI0023A5CFA3|nr:hypothetical protein L3040_003776 [Drepanopeziza brunnea f. sp. 'multigermtubi']